MLSKEKAFKVYFLLRLKGCVLSFRACRETWGGSTQKDTESDKLLKKFKSLHTFLDTFRCAPHSK